MSPATPPESEGSALIVGASRGLGHAMAAEFAGRGWHVMGTVRGGGTPLHALAAERPDTVEIATLDMTDHDEVLALRQRLGDRRFDVVFVNAGIVNSAPEATMAEVSTDEFVQVMVTNVLGVMRTIEAFGDLVAAGGVVGAMSSGQGSIANNTNGRNDVYRASKAALNQGLSSYAARHADRAVMLLAPGWIRTDLGGPGAPVTAEEATPQIVDTLIAQRGTSGLRFLDRNGRTVPW